VQISAVVAVAVAAAAAPASRLSFSRSCGKQLAANFVVSRLDEWLLAEIVAVAMTPLMLVRVGMGRTMGQWMRAFWRRLLIRLLCWLWVGIVVGALQMLTFVQLAVSLVGGILKVYIYVSCINSELIV